MFAAEFVDDFPQCTWVEFVNVSPIFDKQRSMCIQLVNQAEKAVHKLRKKLVNF